MNSLENVGLSLASSHEGWTSLFTLTCYQAVDAMHDGFEKATKHLPNRIIGFSSSSSDCHPHRVPPANSEEYFYCLTFSLADFGCLHIAGE